MCERALAALYRRHANRAGANAPWLVAAAVRRLEDAALLGARLRALGGAPGDGIDDEWIRGPLDAAETLRRAERAAFATYRDHLVDHDSETVHLLRERILPGHAAALVELEDAARGEG
jgi:hypothetical protein